MPLCVDMVPFPCFQEPFQVELPMAFIVLDPSAWFHRTRQNAIFNIGPVTESYLDNGPGASDTPERKARRKVQQRVR
jgi:hypothetical protein